MASLMQGKLCILFQNQEAFSVNIQRPSQYFLRPQGESEYLIMVLYFVEGAPRFPGEKFVGLNNHSIVADKK